MNAERFGLSATTVKKICGIFSLHPLVQKAVLYGSRAKGNYKNGSDIDLTLFGMGLGVDELLTISDELDELLLPYSIDLSIFENIDNPSLRDHIERIGVPFYERGAGGGGKAEG